MSSRFSFQFQWSTQLFGNPFVWLIATLLMITVAYAFLSSTPEQNTAGAVKKITVQPQVPEEPKDELVSEDVIKKDNMFITRETDNQRSEEYLEIEFRDRQTKPFFDSAKRNVSRGQLVSPASDNAWKDFHEVLVIDPDNTQAQAGLTKIRSHLIDNAELAIESGEYGEAEYWLSKLDIIQPDDSLQGELRTDIRKQIEIEAQANLKRQQEKERRQKIENYLLEAKSESESFPVDYGKVKDLYSRILELDPENNDATNGIKRLADKQLDNVELLVKADLLGQAQKLLDSAIENNPDNKRISGIQLALDSREKQIEQEKLDKERQIREQIEQEEKERKEREIELAAERARAKQAQAEREAAEKAAAEAAAKKAAEDIAAAEEAARLAEMERVESQKKIRSGVNAYYQGRYNESFEILYPYAEKNFARAQFRIGIMYRYGRGISEDKDMAAEWFTRALPSILSAAQKGVPWAQTDLGTAYEFGISLKQDYKRAAYWYGLAAEQGYVGAQTNLGVLYATGDGVPYDRMKAIFWLKAAAEQGDAVAKNNLRILGATDK